jgi:predicted permease
MVPTTTLPAMVRDTGSPWFESIARLKPGVTPNQARAQADALFQSYMREHPTSAENRRDNFNHMELAPAARGLGELRERFSAPLKALMAVVGMVLLIACANITNLLLARAARREREFAVRVAIGAGRGRLARQLFVETATLFLTGAAVGALLAWFATRGLLAFLAGGLHPIRLAMHWDWRILTFTTLVSLLATFLSGAAPVLRAIRTDPHAAMNGGARASASREHAAMGRLLVAFQIALSVVLLVGASLFLRTLRNLYSVDPGFRADHVALVSVELIESSYTQQVPRIAAWDRLLTTVRRLPGVQWASLAAMTPLDGSGRRVGLSAPSFTPHSDEDGFVSLNTVSEDYFASLGTPLLRGRAFTEEDSAGVPAVAILNESAARHYFADRDPLGTVVNINSRSSRIVGVVRDVRQTDIRRNAGRVVFIPLRQPYDRNFHMTLAVRTAVDPQTLIGAVERSVRNGGPGVLIESTHTLAQQVDQSLLAERLLSWLAAAFGVLALVLSAVGLYGVMTYSVARRTSEIGICLALGAQPARVARSILRQTVSIIGVGLAAGIPASILVARAVRNLLYGVGPADFATQAGAAILLAAVALAASYLPARRAARIDPLTAMRYE